MRTEATFLGTVASVIGAKVVVEVSADLPSTSPIVNGRIYRLGQIGSFVRIPMGFLNVYGIVAMVGAVDSGVVYLGAQATRAHRTLEIQLVGEAVGGGTFHRGVSQYPTLDDEVHVVTAEDLARIYGSVGLATPITIGSHSASENLPATVDLDRLVSRHAAVVGSTGSGKSNSVAALLQALTAGSFPSANVVVIDPHGEYGRAFEGKSRVLRIGDQSHPLYLPYWALSFDELAWFLVDRRSATETHQDTRLREMIYETRKANVAGLQNSDGGVPLSPDEITVDSPVPFDLKQLWYDLDRLERLTWRDQQRTTPALEMEGSAATLTPAKFAAPGAGSAPPFKNNPVPPMAQYANKILTRLKDRRFAFMLSPGDYDGVTKDLGDLLNDWVGHDSGITVLDLAGVPSEITDLVVGLLTRLLFETMFWGRDIPGIGRQRPLFLVFEEAHGYLPRGEGGQYVQGYARKAVQRVLREGRKYGVGALVVSQRPSELDETILSQCGTFFALRLTNSQDQSRVASMVPDEITGLTNLLPALRTGEAIVLGEAMPLPSRVRITLVSPRPDSRDADVADRWQEGRLATTDFASAIANWRRQSKPVQT